MISGGVVRGPCALLRSRVGAIDLWTLSYRLKYCNGGQWRGWLSWSALVQDERSCHWCAAVKWGIAKVDLSVMAWRREKL